MSKKSSAARFNGTVMMAAPTGVKAAQPANANAEAHVQVGTAQASASAAGAAAPAAAVSAMEAPRMAAGAGRLPAAKATMLGAGIAPARPGAEPAAGGVTPSVRAVVDVPVSPVPERPEPIGHAATQAALPNVAANDFNHPQQHYLPGDPMAPQPSAAEHPHGRSARLHIDHEPTQPGLPKEERIWLYWAVCGVVLLSVLVLAIGLF